MLERGRRGDADIMGNWNFAVDHVRLGGADIAEDSAHCRRGVWLLLGRAEGRDLVGGGGPRSLRGG